jgi:hypothetical protein
MMSNRIVPDSMEAEESARLMPDSIELSVGWFCPIDLPVLQIS